MEQTVLMSMTAFWFVVHLISPIVYYISSFITTKLTYIRNIVNHYVAEKRILRYTKKRFKLLPKL